MAMKNDHYAYRVTWPEEDQEYYETLVQGMVDLEEGRELGLAEVKKRLNIK